MPFATFCDELKVYNSEEPYSFCSSVKVLEKPESYGNISWSGDATFVTVTPSRDPLAIFKHENGQLLPHRFVNFTDVKAATFLNWSNKDIVFGLENGEVRMWNIREKMMSCVLDSGPKQPVNLLTCNLDDTCIASGCLVSGRIGLHSLKTNKYLRSFDMPRGEMTSCIRFCQCKKGYLGACTMASTVCVWDIVKAKMVFNRSNTHQGACTGMEFSPVNYSVLATVSLSQSLKLFDMREKDKILEIKLNEPLHCVDIFEGGDRVAVGTGRGSIFIFDIKANKLSTTIKAYNNIVTALSINKFGKDRKQHGGNVSTSDNPVTSNRTLDLSVMDAFSPITRDNSSGNGRKVSNASVEAISEFTPPSAPVSAQNDSFLSRIFSPQASPMFMSSPITQPSVTVPQSNGASVTSTQAPTCNQTAAVQHNPSNNSQRQAVSKSRSASIVNPLHQISRVLNAPASHLNQTRLGNINQRESQDQTASTSVIPGAQKSTHDSAQQTDLPMENILRELKNIQEEHDLSFKLLSDQMTLLEDTLMSRINMNHESITDLLVNGIKRDVEKGTFDLRYELVSQKNCHMEFFNMIVERTENLTLLIAGLTRQVTELQNIINGRQH